MGSDEAEQEEVDCPRGAAEGLARWGEEAQCQGMDSESAARQNGEGLFL